MRVLYTGAISDLSGYAEAARGNVYSLLAAGVDVRLVWRSFECNAPYAVTDSVVGEDLWKISANGSRGNPDFHIVHLTPDLYPQYYNEARRIIGYFAWEASSLPDVWVESINEFTREVWVPSDFLRNISVDSGVKVPVFVLPHAIAPAAVPTMANELIPELVGSSTYKFYSVFQWSERKNPRGLLRAYLEEFSGDENVELVIKTYRVVGPDGVFDGIAGEIEMAKNVWSGNKKPPRITLLNTLFTVEQMQALHSTCDCYVTMSRSEGFGIPIFVSQENRHPVIVPRFSAFTEYLDESRAYFIPIDGSASVENMNHISPHFTESMSWCEPSVEECRKQMRWVYEHREDAKKKGEAGYEYIRNNLSYEAIGRKMVGRLASL